MLTVWNFYKIIENYETFYDILSMILRMFIKNF
jgi:hypothetical protein